MMQISKGLKCIKLTIIAGARPNFMKIAPVIHAIEKFNAKRKQMEYRLVHTGQHYDRNMSDMFFEELNIPEPDVNLGVGGGTQAEQTAGIMIGFEKELMAHPADLVIVVGDVTSTMACSIVAKKLHAKVAHIEAGIRSWDLTMPEEINRMVTDCLADYYFTTTELAGQNLRNAGAKDEQIFFVGNVMIDTLLANINRLVKPDIYNSLSLKEKEYIMLTLHRPANVDEADKLKALMNEIVAHVHGLPVIFPIHPRTSKIFFELGIAADNLHIVDPMGYLEFNYMVKHAKAVITDSGGITEETTVMDIPCITLRDNTERPETCTIGTNELIGTNPNAIKPALDKLFAGEWKKGGIPERWDGKTAERIVGIIILHTKRL
ncbi:non-hydrolyzing UDP-N-acetylglucosamine 2-epimerase [Limibacterium fermenti]|uniref:non-hydrolyzing UDP-N-acetylglucosamine 2-epimerase n=1 Tax=Limibacterium fermenti TaxID=3229863 RepID=UPI003A742A8D